MRDPKRIRGLINRLATAWEVVPHLRLGQLLHIIFENMREEGQDPFYVEDEAMIAYIEKYVEKTTGVALHE